MQALKAIGSRLNVAISLSSFIVCSSSLGRHGHRREEAPPVSSKDEAAEPPENWIAFVGPTSAGKSRLANDILGKTAFAVGAEHGTTTEVNKAPYRNGWSLADTPGVLDGDKLAAIAADTARRSKIIIVCLDGEMYRQTFGWLEGVLRSVKHGKRVLVVPCLTKSDLREAMMPSRDRSVVWQRLGEQIQRLKSVAGQQNIMVDDLQEGSIGRREDIISKIHWGMDWVNG